MTARLILVDPGLDAEELQALTRRLQQTINRETDFQAELAETPGAAGDKGPMEDFGKLILEGLGGAVEPLIDCLKLFFERDSIEMEFQCADGKRASLKIRAADLEGKRVGETVRMTRKFLADC